MIRSINGPKVLGLCLLAVLSLMAITPAGAQAKGDWFISEVKTTKTEKVTGEIDKAGAIKDIALLSTIGAAKIKILCETLAVSDGLLFHTASANAPSALGSLQFSNCKTFLNDAESAACDIEHEPIVTTVKVLLILHNAKTYLLFSPDDGTLTFVLIRVGRLVNNECGFGPLIPVTGHAVAQCLQSDGSVGCEKEEVTHLIEEVPNVTSLFSAKGADSKFIHQLRFGVNTAVLDGGAILSLPDHPGNWRGLGL